MKSVIVNMDIYGDEKKRIDLSGAVDLDIEIREGAWSTGIKLEAVYFQPRARRVIVKTYSIWDNGRGECQGISYLIAPPEMVARLAEETGNETLVSVVEEA